MHAKASPNIAEILNKNNFSLVDSIGLSYSNSDSSHGTTIWYLGAGKSTTIRH